MLKYVIYFAVLIPVSISQSTPTPSPFQCDPILDCQDAKAAGGRVPDPEDCTKFYVCIASGTDLVPTDSSLPCPAGEYFDQFSPTDCAPETTPGTCENLCKNKPPSVCDTVCTDFKFESVAYPGYCSKYYVCTPSGPLEQSCISPNLYYNGAICVADKSECCDFCTPYCTDPYTQIPDPYDCTSYYFCMVIGPPDNTYHSQCPSGKYFNPDTSNCIPGTDCVSTCSNSTDSDSTTPSTVISIASSAPATASITSTTPASTLTTASKSTGNSITSTTPASTLTTASKSTGNPITTSTSAGSTNATTKTTDLTTTTTATSTTTTTISTSSGGCQSTYVCTVDGNFPRCPYCDQTYFNCKSGTAVINTCDTGKVFNTNPAYPYCITPSDCPYPN